MLARANPYDFTLPLSLRMPFQSGLYNLPLLKWMCVMSSPHSYTQIDRDSFIVGAMGFNRYLKLDTARWAVDLLDLQVGDDLLSSNTWFDAEPRDLWFMSYSLDDAFRRGLKDTARPVRTRLWRQNLASDRKDIVWEGPFADCIHDLQLTKDRRYAIGSELGMHLDAQGRVVPSTMLVVDLQTGRALRKTGIKTGSHIAFDLNDPYVFYASEHNLALDGPCIHLYGPGSIVKYRIGDQRLVVESRFSSDDFYRITTHEVFRHRGRQLIAVTGYPDVVFFIDADTMRLYKTLKIDNGDAEAVDTSRGRHSCTSVVYGLTPTPDGERLFIGTANAAHVYDIETGQRVLQQPFTSTYFFLGHMKNTPSEVLP
jgi:hypothetical protein